MTSAGPRLDAELVRRGLARSRRHAATLIAQSRVTVSGRLITKSAAAVDPGDPVAVRGADTEWASRGAYKLIGALDSFGVSVTGRTALDAGASTGGFTDVLLRRGAAAVTAVDVGHDQIVPRLAIDPRVRVLDRVNVRALTPEQIGEPVELIVADLSFISLRLVLPALIACAAPGADLLPMVKPQFEVGRGRLGRGGVVRDPELRIEAVTEIAEAAADLGWGPVAATASPLPGPAGNLEYFLHLRSDAGVDGAGARTLIRDATRDSSSRGCQDEP